MRILLLGSGGREHALAAALRRDPATVLYTAPGNPGTATLGENLALDATNATAVVEVAREHHIDLVVIGPEAPLVAGVSDALRDAGIAVFGPSKAAAELEASKSFAKNVMTAAGVPTAAAYTCLNLEQVADALREFGSPYVVKDDGLAAGKGVIVTTDKQAALEHAEACIRQGGSVVVEEFLDGPEVSLFCLTDGTTVLPLLPAQDFKRVGEGNTGPNTGGMGAYAPLPWLPPGLTDEVVQRVAQPVVDHMRASGTPFSGLLYCGLALTPAGVKVIEFNARFGDPETQVVLELLESNLADLLHACATGTLASQPALRWREGAAVVVVLAASGYPGTPMLGDPITGIDAADPQLRHAGTAWKDGALFSAGGRVLGVVGSGDDVESARAHAYDILARIQLAGGHYRRDIAANHSRTTIAATPTAWQDEQ